MSLNDNSSERHPGKTTGACAFIVLVLSPDLIRHIYHFQYNARETAAILKEICAGVDFGSGTETTIVRKIDVVATFKKARWSV